MPLRNISSRDTNSSRANQQAVSKKYAQQRPYVLPSDPTKLESRVNNYCNRATINISKVKAKPVNPQFQNILQTGHHTYKTNRAKTPMTGNRQSTQESQRQSGTRYKTKQSNDVWKSQSQEDLCNQETRNHQSIPKNDSDLSSSRNPMLMYLYPSKTISTQSNIDLIAETSGKLELKAAPSNQQVLIQENTNSSERNYQASDAVSKNFPRNLIENSSTLSQSSVPNFIYRKEEPHG